MGQIIRLSETYPRSLIDNIRFSDSEDAFLYLKEYKDIADSENISFEEVIREELAQYLPKDFKLTTLRSLGRSYDLWKHLREQDRFIDDIFAQTDDNFPIENQDHTEGIIIHSRTMVEEACVYSLLQGLFTHERISKDTLRELSHKAESIYKSPILYGLELRSLD